MICGVDEAGRGPVFGPLVIAGVTIQDDSELKEIGVRDSKKLTPNRREILAKKIREIAEKYEIIIISASDIDDMRKVMTLNELEVSAFSKIIEKLRPDVCFVDSADVNQERFGSDILAKLSFKPKIISRHKADDTYPIVGAASIIAKTTRDENVRKIAQELEKKLNLPLGSGYPADPITKNFLKTWIKTYGELPPHTRRSWETAQRLTKENKTRKLDDY